MMAITASSSTSVNGRRTGAAHAPARGAREKRSDQTPSNRSAIRLRDRPVPRRRQLLCHALVGLLTPRLGAELRLLAGLVAEATQSSTAMAFEKCPTEWAWSQRRGRPGIAPGSLFVGREHHDIAPTTNARSNANQHSGFSAVKPSKNCFAQQA